MKRMKTEKERKNNTWGMLSKSKQMSRLHGWTSDSIYYRHNFVDDIGLNHCVAIQSENK